MPNHNRRDLLKGLALAAPITAAAAQAKPPGRKGPKNWVWIPTIGADAPAPAPGQAPALTNTLRSDDEWKRKLDKIAASGVQALLLEVYDGREAFFDSARLPRGPDWLGQMLPLARAQGLEVHAWMWSMPCLIPEIIQAHPDWYNVNALGESAADKPAYVPYYRFLDPGLPEVRAFVQGTVKELAAIPGLTGVHLDYIRHPDALLPTGLWSKYAIFQDKVLPAYDYGYTAYERGRFRDIHGVDPLNIPAGDETLRLAWLQFRFDMVTGLVNDWLVPAARAGGKQITAAVFPGPAIARTHVRQDWGRWNLDGFLPMLYDSFYLEGPEWIARQTREGAATVKAPVYAGLFVQPMELDAFRRSVELSLAAGASGVSIFSDGGMSEEKWDALRRITAQTVRA